MFLLVLSSTAKTESTGSRSALLQLRDTNARGSPGERTGFGFRQSCKNADRIGSTAACIAGECLMALSHRHRHDIRSDTGRKKRRRLQRSLTGLDFNDIPLCDSKIPGCRWIDLNPTTPHGGRNNVRQFLQPRKMRERSIKERLRSIGKEVEWIILRPSVKLSFD